MIGGIYDRASFVATHRLRRVPSVDYTDLRFQPPARQSTIIASARPIAVSEITHQIPTLPHRDAAHAASVMRETVIAVDDNIGATVWLQRQRGRPGIGRPRCGVLLRQDRRHAPPGFSLWVRTRSAIAKSALAAADCASPTTMGTP